LNGWGQSLLAMRSYGLSRKVTKGGLSRKVSKTFAPGLLALMLLQVALAQTN